ncbi:unannotated protein [freshwater metagenome]|uniref:Unannotated protein n=1 Tax=freshwater metagenome TaxID=449393 RepID=A0A6J7KGG9_9ZZZZ
MHEPAGVVDTGSRAAGDLCDAASTFEASAPQTDTAAERGVSFFPRSDDDRRALAVPPGFVVDPTAPRIAELALNAKTFRNTPSIALLIDNETVAEDPERIKQLLTEATRRTAVGPFEDLHAPEGCSITAYRGRLMMLDPDGTMRNLHVVTATNAQTSTGFYVHGGLPDQMLSDAIGLVLAPPSTVASCRRRANLACRRFADRTAASETSSREVRSSSHLAFGAMAYLRHFCDRHPETFT